MMIVQVIALIFVGIICMGIIAFLVSLWRKWMREMERNQTYQVQQVVNADNPHDEALSHNDEESNISDNLSATSSNML